MRLDACDPRKIARDQGAGEVSTSRVGAVCLENERFLLKWPEWISRMAGELSWATRARDHTMLVPVVSKRDPDVIQRSRLRRTCSACD